MASVSRLVRIAHWEVAMIVGTLRMRPLPERRGDLLEILGSVQGRVLAQPGCVAFQVYEEQEPGAAIVLVERWESESALELHLRSEAYRRILGAMELSSVAPEVTFDHISAARDLERTERLRDPATGLAAWRAED